jgi:tRNA threonylcarbamoyladenosine biosynthesis protein TsaB
VIRLILGIETATRRGSVCIARGNTVLATRLGDANSSHSNTLLRDVQDLLDESQLSIGEITLIAAAIGPGSFTGLRIGLASAKALAATLSIPSIGVPTLEAVARAAGPAENSVALLPAGRGELFAQMFSVAEDLSITKRDEPGHLSPDELFNRYGNEQQIRWCGEGAHAWRKKLQEWAEAKGISFTESGSGWTLAPLEPMLATHVAALGLERFEQGDSGDPDGLRALYVRPSDAELKQHDEHPARN